MPTVKGQPRLRGADQRLLRGYGPALAIAVTLLLASLLAPTVQPENLVAEASSGPGTEVLTPTDVTGGGAKAPGGPGTKASDPSATPGSAPPLTKRCTGRQLPNDPYSPPCVTWTGTDNGGSTSRGVTARDINITFRVSEYANIGTVVSQLSGGKVQIDEDVDDIKRTVTVLTKYFNDRFEFYGRRIKVRFFNAQGNLANEVLGGGQAGAQADAVNAAQQQHAFADGLSLTQAYSEALVAQKVIALNQIYFSRDWYRAHAPYAYSGVPDCTTIVEGTAQMYLRQLKGQATARYAGGDLKDKKRKLAILVPDNRVYTACGNLLKTLLARGGVRVAEYRTYPLDINSITNSTPQNLVSALSGAGITTVILLTDPVLPFFMTSKAALQKWSPEWLLTGVGFTDADYVGQLYEQEQWAHAFGVSYLAKQQPVRASDAYRAYKATDPKTSIAQLSGTLIYQALEMIAIGIQGAGPNLTPQTFQQGLKRYPGGTGQFGTWKFPAHAPYTPNADSRIVWWDPRMPSSYNGAAGAYADNGRRYPIGKLPSGNPPIYLRGGP